MIDTAMQTSPLSQKLAGVSVSDFFGQINWYGRILPVTDEVSMDDMPYETVGQFFGTFPWQESTPVLPPDDWESTSDMPPLEDSSLTLKDLSALF